MFRSSVIKHEFLNLSCIYIISTLWLYKLLLKALSFSDPKRIKKRNSFPGLGIEVLRYTAR